MVLRAIQLKEEDDAVVVTGVTAATEVMLFEFIVLKQKEEQLVVDKHEEFMIGRKQIGRRGHRSKRPSPEAKQGWLRVVLFALISSVTNPDRDLVNLETLSSNVFIMESTIAPCPQ